MAVYTHLTSETIADLLTQYRLGRLDFAIGIAQGVENSNYLLNTLDEAGTEQKAILTVYEQRVKREELPFFLSVMEHLATKQFPAPMPLQRKDGSVIGDIEGKPFSMVTFLHGQSRSSANNAQIGSVGETLARLHAALSDFKGQRENDLSLVGWQRIASELDTRLDEIQSGLRELVAAEVEYLSRCWPQHLPSGVIHADLFPDNVFFAGDTVSGVIDYYFACNDLLAYELAICLNCWCFEAGGEFNVTKAQRMLQHYHRQRPLSEEEIAALPTLARGAALRFLLTRAQAWLNRVPGALVTPKDPLEYARKLRFHQQVKNATEYGWR